MADDIKAELAAMNATLGGMSKILTQLDTDIRTSNANNQLALTTIEGHRVKIKNIEKDIDALWGNLKSFKNWIITSMFAAMGSIIAWLITISGAFGK